MKLLDLQNTKDLQNMIIGEANSSDFSNKKINSLTPQTLLKHYKDGQ